MPQGNRRRDGSPRRDPFDRPADMILLALRRTSISDPYRNEGIGRWRACCPACPSGLYQHRSLSIAEYGYGGPVSLRCENGCESGRILNALRNRAELAA